GFPDEDASRADPLELRHTSGESSTPCVRHQTARTAPPAQNDAERYKYAHGPLPDSGNLASGGVPRLCPSRRITAPLPALEGEAEGSARPAVPGPQEARQGRCKPPGLRNGFFLAPCGAASARFVPPFCSGVPIRGHLFFSHLVVFSFFR